MRYFFEINYLPKRASNNLIAAHCISILHGTVSRDKCSSIGVSFPDWNGSDVGQSIAFISKDEDKLLKLSKHFDFRVMEEESVITISELKQVPIEVTEVQYIRNNGIAKLTLAERKRRIERCVLRAKRSGREYQPQHEYKDRSFGLFHKLILISQSSRRSFPLYIEKVEGVKEVKCDFSHYGLGSNQLIMGTVPDLSFDH
ncbi:type I-F CRISPR-associated endoribonuclease Cas6/Csy4 [Shewanella sp. 202IG2-18]|uniref:type I-F CRISPR-associated endoribonuclease Cas6/Csy4 n=1 Tax=Parashewanella hymeniacidonis TaxID=2807618 RepID=UPI001961E2A1|nr:type I-F CRISPR-associated endoribonuclease Cas6/Csy4 [Parashewanella hymeniacidonis]MBM7070675.1 type I-F CRISPR-associated endoribonuclease Cas6/Csy4 [Parashewanella hymeniacidonis]